MPYDEQAYHGVFNSIAVTRETAEEINSQVRGGGYFRDDRPFNAAVYAERAYDKIGWGGIYIGPTDEKR